MKIYVNVNAGHDGNGTEQMPFRHINDAAKIALLTSKPSSIQRVANVCLSAWKFTGTRPHCFCT